MGKSNIGKLIWKAVKKVGKWAAEHPEAVQGTAEAMHAAHERKKEARAQAAAESQLDDPRWEEYGTLLCQLGDAVDHLEERMDHSTDELRQRISGLQDNYDLQLSALSTQLHQLSIAHERYKSRVKTWAITGAIVFTVLLAAVAALAYLL